MADMDEIEAAALVERVRAHAQERTPSLAAGTAIVAVSGGADSAAALGLLVEAGVVNPGQAVAAHFDHGLRGAGASARDRAAVEALCARYSVELVAGAWDAPRAGEAAARDARYAFLADVAARRSMCVIATGHTADDQAETVLLHASRGAGLHGLRGMAAEAGRRMRDGRDEIMGARPLLCVTREETRAFCALRGIAFEDDASNEDRSFARNRVRLDVLPAMEGARPGARAALLRMAEEARATVAALEQAASAAIVGREGDAVVLSRAVLRTMAGTLAPYAYRLAIEHLLGHARDIERKHYAIMSRAAEARTGAVFELPQGVIVLVAHDAVIVSRGTPSAPAIDARFEAGVPFEGVVGLWSLRVAPADEGGLRLAAGAVVRRRRAGDRMRLRGGMKKLQDVFVDLKVPRYERDAVPVIAAGEDVMWTPFVAAVGGSEGSVYEIEAVRV